MSYINYLKIEFISSLPHRRSNKNGRLDKNRVVIDGKAVGISVPVLKGAIINIIIVLYT